MEEEKKNSKKTLDGSDPYVVLPLRDIVMFPGMIAPLFVGRIKSINAIQEAARRHSKILLVTQTDPSIDNPKQKDIHKIGVVGKVLQMLKLPDNTIKVLIEALYRVKVKKLQEKENFYVAQIDIASEDMEFFDVKRKIEADALVRAIVKDFEEYLEFSKKAGADILASISDITEYGKLADYVASHISLSVSEKQKIFEVLNVVDRLEAVFQRLQSEIEILKAEKKIKQRIKEQMEKTQKDYYLNEQMKAIQKEINEANGENGKSDFDEIENKIKKVVMSEEAREKINAEFKKLKMMSGISAEASIVRNYIDTMINLPWNKVTKIKNDLLAAEKFLNVDHYGLEKVKERVLEYLAVNQRNKKMNGPILCLVGPPGVGKTSLAKSIADAVGRKFAKFSLGGMKDESEIRGHRKTYVGAMPGKILQLLKKVKYNNPVMLLDEIDKLGSDYRGDPSFALLEVLDPEQNKKFMDHYLEVDYDLSNIMFIATANSLNIPRPLLDRMEVIKLSGYTEDEKVQIALRHMVLKQKQAHGLKAKELEIEEPVIRDIVRYYTREAGVRNLEKEIAKLCRKVLREIIEKKCKSVVVNSDNIEHYLGMRKYDFGKAEGEDLVGITTGLAYTEVGGDLLSLEAVSLPGKGEIKLTGKLGEVMQESAQAAFSYFKSQSLRYGIIPPEYQKRDLHLHAPEGAIPKDGPSAGIAMFSSIVSVMTGNPVRSSVAMTGEITLRGRVLPIGGLKEKLLAAQRGGIKTVLIPKENMKDLQEIPAHTISMLEIIPVSNADEVIEHALVNKVIPVEWHEVPEQKIEVQNNVLGVASTHHPSGGKNNLM